MSVLRYLNFRRAMKSLCVLSAAAFFALPAPAMACDGAYTVRAGDSIGRIAARCDVSAKELILANADLKNPSQLRIGQTLKVPGFAPKTAIAATPAELDTWTGRIVSGRRCALLEMADGTLYGLASRRVIFTTGKKVEVEGRVVKARECESAKMLIVSDLRVVK